MAVSSARRRSPPSDTCCNAVRASRSSQQRRDVPAQRRHRVAAPERRTADARPCGETPSTTVSAGAPRQAQGTSRQRARASRPRTGKPRPWLPLPSKRSVSSSAATRATVSLSAACCRAAGAASSGVGGIAVGAETRCTARERSSATSAHPCHKSAVLSRYSWASRARGPSQTGRVGRVSRRRTSRSLQVLASQFIAACSVRRTRSRGTGDLDKSPWSVWAVISSGCITPNRRNGAPSTSSSRTRSCRCSGG
mmetsp:Transcript_99656/g.281273  ORF Transcript_99656/g.281273 Transcript_99656/m.281273 type:complete len:252 (-) Transcript_99656:982-1737(-)